MVRINNIENLKDWRISYRYTPATRQSFFVFLLCCMLFLSASAAIVEAAKASNKLNGVFVTLNTPWRHISLTADEWGNEFDAMEALGIDTLIVQYVVRDYDNGSFKAAYPSSTFQQEADTNQIRYILDQADARGFKVYLGLVHKKTW